MSVYQDVAVSVDSVSIRSRRPTKNSFHRYEEISQASQENQFLKAYNQSPAGNNSFAFPAINNVNYRTINASKVSERQTLSPSAAKKKSAIEELTERNDMLQRQVLRVQRILNKGQPRVTNKLLPDIDGKVIKKQLENAYKQIKQYEIDIAQRQKMFEHEGAYIDMIRKAELTVIERQDMVKKLEAEISQLKKQSNEFVKLLQDGHIKKEYANKSSRLHNEIKFYETQLNSEEELELSDCYNMEDKGKRIAEMEKELLMSGFDQKELLMIREKYQKSQKVNYNTINRKTEAVGEDRSKKAFQELKGQVVVLKKMQKDHAKKSQQLQKQRVEADKGFQKSKKIVQQTQKQIIRLEQAFMQMKKKIDPDKLKPLFKNGSLTDSSITQFGASKGNQLEHRFDTVQAGEYHKKHTVVNDRPAIGKKSAYIVELTLFQNRIQFLGFQAGYLIGETYQKGNSNVLRRQNQRFLKDKTVKLQPGDYFKTFECSISKENIIIGFIAVSFKGKVIKAGQQEGFKKQLDVKGKQYPCCMYGSYSVNGFEMMGIQKVETQ